MAAASKPDDESPDLLDQIRQLRAQVERLARDRVAPAVAEMADQISDAANDQADYVALKVRRHPFQAVLISAGVGFLIGRFMR
jgi:ElaB/YqjD/DUF883 family membrane-anchored ribosome-binding protein